tara:strand:+ start:986 stop:1612 length:627 start_codon:yes stop_codon:yes gene_type:complete
MQKFLIIFTLLCSTNVYYSISQARNEKSEVRFDVTGQASGHNTRRASSETTKSFSGRGYGLEYIFENNVGLGYRTETITTEIESYETISKSQGVQSNALELSFLFSSSNLKSFLSRFTLQLGLGSVFSGEVMENKSLGNDLLSDYNSTHSITGSTQFAILGYSFDFFSLNLGYRIWDVWAYHSDSQKNTIDLGHFNWSSISTGLGFLF